MVIGCSLADQPSARDGRDDWREKVREIHVNSTAWWWRWWYINRVRLYKEVFQQHPLIGWLPISIDEAGGSHQPSSTGIAQKHLNFKKSSVRKCSRKPTNIQNLSALSTKINSVIKIRYFTGFKKNYYFNFNFRNEKCTSWKFLKIFISNLLKLKES